MRLFGSERMMNVYKALGIPEGEEIHHKTITKQIEKAQKKIENNNFGIRKNLLDYDQVNNDQREVIYAERRRVLDGESMRDVIYRMIKDTVSDDVNMIGGEAAPEEWNMVELNETLRRKIPLNPIRLEENEEKEELIERLQNEAMELYHAKEKEFEDFAREHALTPEDMLDEEAAAYREGIREVERVILLRVIDSKWMNHIDDMDQLRQSIGLQAYGQKDPVVQYKFLGYEMFEEMTKNIRHDTVGALMHVQIQQKVEREQVAKATGTNKDDTVAKGPYKRKEAKIGRNAPCPCGSGKKYKKERNLQVVQLDEYKAKINQYREPMEELKRSLELEKKKATIEELEAKMEEPDFWSAPEKAQEITRELKNLKDTADTFSGLEEMTEDILTLIEMGYEENDESLLPEIGDSAMRTASRRFIFAQQRKCWKNL